MDTSELTGPALDWAVSAALKYGYEIVDGAPVTGATTYTAEGLWFDEVWEPSTDWSQGGPIIERENITMMRTISGSEFGWIAWKNGERGPHKNEFSQYGPTQLIAAMRCFVVSVLGEEIEVPEELLK